MQLYMCDESTWNFLYSSLIKAAVAIDKISEEKRNVSKYVMGNTQNKNATQVYLV